MTVPQLSRFANGPVPVVGDQLNTFVQTCNDADQMRAFVGAANMSVFARGMTTAGDGLQGIFSWNPTSTGPDDNLNIIQPYGVTLGAWTRSTPVVTSTTSNQYFVTPAQFGGQGNGVADDTAAVQAAFDTAASSGFAVLLLGVAGVQFKTTAPLTISADGMRIFGSSNVQTMIIASGNFGGANPAILQIKATAANIYVENVGFVQTNTTNACVALAVSSQAINFFCCAFTGNLTGDLIYSQCAGFLLLGDCVYQCNSAGTNALRIDGYNQNTVVSGGRAGGTGTFLAIVNTSGPAPQGIQVTNGFVSICTGETAISVQGSAFYVSIEDSIIDQAHTTCILVGNGAALVTIEGCYVGLQAGSVGQPVFVDASSGAAITIANNKLFGGNANVAVGASASVRAAGIAITGNDLFAAAQASLQLDSVNGCQISGNTEHGSPAQGSFVIFRTNSLGGAYSFGADNSWSTTLPSTIDPASGYTAEANRGVTLVNRGFASAGSGSTMTVAHGLLLTPDIILLSPEGSVGNFNYLNVTSTDFEISWGTSGAAAFSWEARVNR